MGKSQKPNRPLNRPLDQTPAEEAALSFVADLPLTFRHIEATQEFEVECCNLAVQGQGKAVTLRLRFSPGAARTLSRQLRVIEKILGREIGADPEPSSRH